MSERVRTNTHLHSRAVNRLHAEEKCGKPHLYESGKPHESTVDLTPDVRINPCIMSGVDEP